MSEITINWLWFVTAFTIFAILLRKFGPRFKQDPGRSGGGRWPLDPTPDPAPNVDHYLAPAQGADRNIDRHFRFTGDSQIGHGNRVLDQVSARHVPAVSARAYFYRGTVYFFASEANRARFIASPGAFLSDGVGWARGRPMEHPPTINMVTCEASSRCHRHSASVTEIRAT